MLFFYLSTSTEVLTLHLFKIQNLCSQNTSLLLTAAKYALWSLFTPHYASIQNLSSLHETINSSSPPLRLICSYHSNRLSMQNKLELSSCILIDES